MSECIICFESNKHDTFTLSCGHCFHNKCITHWLMKENTCPTCRKPIVISNAPPIPDVEEEEDYIEDYSLFINFNELNLKIPKNTHKEIIGLAIDEIELYIDCINNSSIEIEEYWMFDQEMGKKYICMSTDKTYKGKNRFIKTEKYNFIITFIDIFNTIAYFTVDLIGTQVFFKNNYKQIQKIRFKKDKRKKGLRKY